MDKRLKIWIFIGLIAYVIFQLWSNRGDYKVVLEEDSIPAAITFPAESASYLLPEVIRSTDKNIFSRMVYQGKSNRSVYDWSIKDDTIIRAYIYHAYYEDGKHTEIQVSPEFSTEDSAQVQALRFAKVIGLLPVTLRRDIQKMTVFSRQEKMYANPFHIFVNVTEADTLEEMGMLEEIMLHEAGHASLDLFYSPTDDWQLSQQLDGRFISTYAEEFPDREDMTVSFLFYLAVTYRVERLDSILVDSILAIIPNRLNFMSKLDIDYYPIIDK